uniref:MULE transposase domain-containing protein n=1 Tax=Lactuca sativa TaxID=4236 RepID=A0A9R1W7X3_LACSA|nr:hypothetical protein LSAT_V11C300152710 [Lactuca sativa]
MTIELTIQITHLSLIVKMMFWADEMEKAYYAEFGDVILFDATFRTNKYRMVFVPFTAIDHHKKSVTVGSGLLSNESIESYSWLLKAFLKTHGKEPTLVLTDQDAAIKQAVENVFRNSRHRLYDLFTNTDFRKRFSKFVWDINIKPDVFEVKWGLLMKEFNLEDTRWFKDMFTIRDSWIPGYFSDIPMCGLMKTTSRSESMNSFFNTYSESGNLLLNFMMNYDTAIQKQRNTQRELDRASKKASYKMQASKVYTSTLFFEVQKEIYKACFFFTYSYVGIEDGWEVYIVQHNNSKSDFKNEFKVILLVFFMKNVIIFIYCHTPNPEWRKHSGVDDFT